MTGYHDAHHFDAFKDAIAELTTPDATHGEREDQVRVAQRFPLRALVIHGRATRKAGRDGRVARPQSEEES